MHLKRITISIEYTVEYTEFVEKYIYQEMCIEVLIFSNDTKKDRKQGSAGL